MSWYKKSKKAPAEGIDRPLIYFSKDDPWTLRDAFSGTFISGATGSGKTSGSGQTIRRAFLGAGLGGLVLTVKEDECQTWIDDARKMGREDSIVVIDASASQRLNYMQYEVNRSQGGAGLTENLVGLFSDVMEAIDGNSGAHDDYWSKARDQLLRNAIDLALAATGSVDLSLIDRIILEAPKSQEELALPKLAERFYTIAALVEAAQRTQDADEVTKRNVHMANNYWFVEYPGLADRTRSSIVSTFRAASDLLNRGLLWQIFSTKTTFVPEMSREGVIFIVDLPVKVHHDAGIIAQILIKYLWQRAMERPYKGSSSPTPVFLWVDEYQSFAVSSDALFQSTARSKQIATVYMTQNLPGLYHAMGGDAAINAVESTLGNLCTYIFHSNSDNKTNEWAAEKIGRILQKRHSSSSSGSSGEQGSTSISTSQDRDHQVPPHAFTCLRNGGPRNDLTVDAFIFQTGRIWSASNANFLHVQFEQE